MVTIVSPRFLVDAWQINPLPPLTGNVGSLTCHTAWHLSHENLNLGAILSKLFNPLSLICLPWKTAATPPAWHDCEGSTF